MQIYIYYDVVINIYFRIVLANAEVSKGCILYYLSSTHKSCMGNSCQGILCQGQEVGLLSFQKFGTNQMMEAIASSFFVLVEVFHYSSTKFF